MITTTIHIERDDTEIPVLIEADYFPATPDRLHPFPGEPGTPEHIDILFATGPDKQDIVLTRREEEAAEDAVRYRWAQEGER
jgi:hypothetical protein